MRRAAWKRAERRKEAVSASFGSFAPLASLIVGLRTSFSSAWKASPLAWMFPSLVGAVGLGAIIGA